jgi:signal peptidase I
MSIWAAIGQHFAKILLILFFLTGIFWLLEKFYFAKQRQELGITKKPLWLEFTADIFPVIAFIFILRSFFFEPFKIPSGSMIPTLQVGDFILVNKYAYGIRFPVFNKKIVEVGSPKRGDVVVFRYPKDESVDYIKRVIGVPGDIVEYTDKRLMVNGQAFTYQPIENVPETGREFNLFGSKPLHFNETFPKDLGGVEHMIENDPQRPSGVMTEPFKYFENCQYNYSGFRCKVPEGHYFMMGDNRDNSLDSRYWGFVPDQNLVGRAFFVWMNFGDLKRIGSFK